MPARRRARATAARYVLAANDDAAQQPEEVDRDHGRLGRRVRPVLPPVRPAQAVEGDRAEDDGDERHRPGLLEPFGERAEGYADDDLPPSRTERRHAGEEAEVGAEAVAVLEPRRAAERGGAGPGDPAVDERRCRDRPWVIRRLVGELEGDESDQKRGCRPDPKPLWVGEGRAPGPSPSSGQVRDGIRRCPPRVQHSPYVAQQDGEERHPQPEDDVDEGRRQVQGRRVRSDEAGGDHQHEQRHADRADDDPQNRRQQHALQSGRQRALSRPLEARLLPQHTERDERRNEDERRSVVEEPRRDGQVLNRPDPVGEHGRCVQAHGSTERSAICRPSSSSSTSKRPGIVARNGILAGPWAGIRLSTS